MTPERWERVQDLYHASRARPDRERAQFLADVCAGDDALRREVQALLDQPSPRAALSISSADPRRDHAHPIHRR
jgi:hypothetical protein